MDPSLQRWYDKQTDNVPDTMNVPVHLMKILRAISNNQGNGLLVGGCVRDDLMGLEPKDHDVEVYNLSVNNLIGILSEFGKVDAVGKSFGVLKLGPYDFSLPRRDNKQGEGHTGFIVEVDPDMTVEEACARRDFTINSIAYDPISGEYIDPFNGRGDIKKQILAPTSIAFKEDPLRVLRGMQFAGRFGMHPSDNCIEMCQQVHHEYYTLSIERVWGEWSKWAEKSISPSDGLQFLNKVGWLDLYPALNDLIGCWQDSRWHPEGWSAELLQSDIASVYSSLTSTAKPIGVDNGFSFRQFVASPLTQTASVPTLGSAPSTQSVEIASIDGLSLANMTGPFDLGSAPTFSPTTLTQSECLVGGIFSPAMKANKIIRVMFEIPLSCVKSVMQGAVDDFQVIDRVIQPITVFMMDLDRNTSANWISFHPPTHRAFLSISLNKPSTNSIGDAHVPLSISGFFTTQPS